MNYAPIALFVYNRPRHTRRAVEALLGNAEAAGSWLYVYSDAPRNAAANQSVAEVRAYLRSVSGFARITLIEREQNLGLAGSVMDGVSALCEKHGRAIVLEDDLVTSSHFLEYMNSALCCYENEHKVMQVAGYMFPLDAGPKEDALFLPFTSSWGWATWRRAWKLFEPDTPGYQILLADAKLRKAFNLGGKYNYFGMLESQRNGGTDSWAIRWYLSVFLHQGLTLYPRKTLVENTGFDGSGVNCIASDFAGDSIDPEFRVRSLPSQLQVSPAYSMILQSFPKPKLNLKAVLNRLTQRTVRSPK